MEEESITIKNDSKEIIDVEELIEKTKDIKQNIIRITIGNDISSGFLCKIYINNNPMPALITCYHVLNEDYIANYDFLYFAYSSDEGITEKILDLNIKRIIYQNKKLDVTIIEIKEEDNLDIYSFLEMDNSINVNNPQFLYQKVYLLHFPKGVEKIQFSQGEVGGLIDNTKIVTNNWTEPGSSGSPIINYKNNYVIGIHKGSSKDEKDSTGIGIILNYSAKRFSEEKSEEIKNSYKNLYPSSNTMDMIYFIPKKQSSIKLFCDKFIDKYKTVCNLIYNGINYSLIQYFPINDITNTDKNKGEIRITLKGIEFINSMEFMFSRCYELKKVIASGTDFSNIEDMQFMFDRCEYLEEITNTSKWNLEKVKSMKGLFYKCHKLKDVPGIDKWNPIKITSCEEMFLSCKSLKSSVISKVENWKNVNENIKQLCKKGYTSNNLFAYAFGENFGGTMKFVADQLNIFKKK